MVNGRVERKNARRINGDKEEPEKPRIGVKKKKNRKKTLANDTYTLTARCRSATYSHAKRFRLIKLLGNKRIKEKQKKKKILWKTRTTIYIYIYTSLFPLYASQRRISVFSSFLLSFLYLSALRCLYLPPDLKRYTVVNPWGSEWMKNKLSLF